MAVASKEYNLFACRPNNITILSVENENDSKEIIFHLYNEDLNHPLLNSSSHSYVPYFYVDKRNGQSAYISGTLDKTNSTVSFIITDILSKKEGKFDCHINLTYGSSNIPFGGMTFVVLHGTIEDYVLNISSSDAFLTCLGTTAELKQAVLEFPEEYAETVVNNYVEEHSGGFVTQVRHDDDMQNLQTQLATQLNETIQWNGENINCSATSQGWETGYYATDGGAAQASTKYIRTIGSWAFGNDLQVNIRVPNGYTVQYTAYDSDDGDFSSSSGFYNPLVFSPNSSFKYKFTVQKWDDNTAGSVISGTQINPQSSFFVDGTIVSNTSAYRQINNLENQINDALFVDNTTSISWSSSDWVTGYIETTNDNNNIGKRKDSGKYICTSDFWNFPNGSEIHIDCPTIDQTTYQIRYAEYNGYDYVGSSGLFTSLVFYPKVGHKYKFTISKFNSNDASSKLSSVVSGLTSTVTYVSFNTKINSIIHKSTKILAIGNSWCRDSVRWLWTILHEAGYETKIVQAYMGGVHLHEMYFGIDNVNYAYTHNTWQQKTHDTYQTWTYTSDNPIYNPPDNIYQKGEGEGLTLESIVKSDTWDYVLFLGSRQYTAKESQYNDNNLTDTYTSGGTEITQIWDINSFIQKVKGWCTGYTPKVFYMTAWCIAENTTGQHWTDAINTYYNTEWAQAEQDRTAFYELINENITKALQYGMYHMSNNIDGFVDLAKALYYARQDTYLSQFGFEMQRAETNSHLAVGLPMYMCSFAIANCLFGIKPSDVFTLPDFGNSDNSNTDIGDETAVSSVSASKGLLYLAKKYAEKANCN